VLFQGTKYNKVRDFISEGVEVFTAVNILVEVFWFVTPRRVEIGFRESCCLRLYSEDEGNKFLRNVGVLHGVTSQKSST